MSRPVRSPVCALFLMTLLFQGVDSFAGERTLQTIAERTNEQQTASPVNRVIRYSLLVRNPTDKVVQGGTVEVYAPLRNGPSHRLSSLRATTDHLVTYDDLDNAVVHIKVAELGPHATLSVAVEASVEISPLDSGQEIEASTYSMPDDFVESNHPAIAALAVQLRTQSDVGSAKAIYEWVAQGVRYTGYLAEAKGALRTLQ